MTRELKTGHRGPARGEAERIVVLLHGYGADGNDLLGLADPLMPHMSGTAFLAPNAPEPCVGNPFGYQWFPIPWLDGSSEASAAESMAKSVEDVNAFLDAVLRDEGIAPKDLMLVGFSQGTMMSLYVAPRRDEQFACVVGFSGRLIDENLAEEAKVRPPVLLVHGDQDEMIPVADMSTAETGLLAAGVHVTSHISRGIGHGIAPDGLTLALQFLMQHLGISAPG